MNKKISGHAKLKSNTKSCKAENEEAIAIKWASIRTNPTKNAALTLKHIFKDEMMSLKNLHKCISEQAEKTIAGDTRFTEEVLISQVQSLQAIFNYIAIRISYSESLEQMQIYSEIAFKANNACRKTILALNQIKNPNPTTFIRQQNNAINQQVNNRADVESSKKSSNLTNELLSEVNNEALDYRGTTETITASPPMEAVEVFDRCKDARREGGQ